MKSAPVLIMMIDNNKSISIESIRKLSKHNLIYVISNKFKERLKNVTILKTPKTKNFLSFLPSVIYGQLFSYKIALRMDERKKFIQNLIDNNFNKNSTLNLKKLLKKRYLQKELKFRI